MSLPMEITYVAKPEMVGDDNWQQLCDYADQLFFRAMSHGYALADDDGLPPLVSPDVISVNGVGADGFQAVRIFQSPVDDCSSSIREENYSRPPGYQVATITHGLPYTLVALALLTKAEELGILTIRWPYRMPDGLMSIQNRVSRPLTDEEKEAARQVFYWHHLQEHPEKFGCAPEEAGSETSGQTQEQPDELDSIDIPEIDIP